MAKNNIIKSFHLIGLQDYNTSPNSVSDFNDTVLGAGEIAIADFRQENNPNISDYSRRRIYLGDGISTISNTNYITNQYFNSVIGQSNVYNVTATHTANTYYAVPITNIFDSSITGNDYAKMDMYNSGILSLLVGITASAAGANGTTISAADTNDTTASSIVAQSRKTCASGENYSDTIICPYEYGKYYWVRPYGNCSRIIVAVTSLTQLTELH